MHYPSADEGFTVISVILIITVTYNEKFTAESTDSDPQSLKGILVLLFATNTGDTDIWYEYR